MALTKDDIRQIRVAVFEGMEAALYPRLADIDEEVIEQFRDLRKTICDLSKNRKRIEKTFNDQFDRLVALENDMRLIYAMLGHRSKVQESIDNMSLETKIALTYYRAANLAKKAGLLA